MTTNVRHAIDEELTTRQRDILSMIAHFGGELDVKQIQGQLSEIYDYPGREVVPRQSVYRAGKRLEERGYVEVRNGEIQRLALTEQAEEQLWSLGQFYNLFGELNPGESEDE